MEINNKKFIRPINIEGTKKIWEQLFTCICKVKNNQKISTGFFCKIPYNNTTKIPVLITSYQIIDEYYFNQNNTIKLLMNDFNQLKVINLDPTRNYYFNPLYNTTIIELKDYDNINNFLELNDTLFENNLQNLFKEESIYILQYLNGGKASVSYGIINKLNGFNIKHTCYINSGSIGAPILDINSNKVIGITLEPNNNLNYNEGVILKFPIEDFINKYHVKNNPMPNMFNNNLNNNFPNMGMNNNFMPNMMFNNNITFMPNMMGMNINFNNDNEEWLKGFQMGVENKDDREKMNVIFKAQQSGTITTLTLKYGTTIDKMLEKYLNRIGRPELYREKTDRIAFLFNNYKLRFGDQTPIEKFFENPHNPKIVVDDLYNLNGGSLNKQIYN